MFRSAALAVLVSASAALAGPAEVVGATATRTATHTATHTGETWRFDVTVRHADTGWDHYADGWRVLAQNGAELGYRKLLHPHVAEQPFTRSLAGVEIPDGTARVEIQAHDSVHGWGAVFVLELGTGF